MKDKKKKSKSNLPRSSELEIPSRYPLFTNRFREDCRWWCRTDKQTADKVFDLVTAVMKDPFQGIGKPELLKHLDPDTWSRRITREHRLIYRVRKERIDFLQARYHYEESS